MSDHHSAVWHEWTRRHRQWRPLALVGIDVWSPSGRRAVGIYAPWAF